MDFHFAEWANLLLRWAHLLTGISWIGSSFYFMWLDSHLTLPEKPKADVEGELWMVHSGGFYQVERKRIAAGSMPKVLHWFKYEALFTWVTGIFLLGLIYHLTGGLYLTDPAVSSVSPGLASAIAIGTLIVGWFVYDGLWLALGEKHGTLATAISLVLGAGVAVGFCSVLSGRAAFIHFGALLGTIMVANVWVRILPAQQKMIDATAEGRTPDFGNSAKAKRRSVHNSYMTFPVLFMMLSNHYALLFGHHLNWLVLLLLTILGMAVRHVMIAKDGNGEWAVAPASLALVGLMALTGTKGPSASPTASGPHVTFTQAHAVITSRCVQCHSKNPTIKLFGPSPGGVHFDEPKNIQAMRERIKFRAVVSKSMPLANMTQITDEERELLGRWIDQGARIDD
jgi:uncharacterized membrane protein